jgi:hypothetical protein
MKMMIVHKTKKRTGWAILLAILTNPPPLFNIFETAELETPGCLPVSAYALPYSIIDISND